MRWRPMAWRGAGGDIKKALKKVKTVPLCQDSKDTTPEVLRIDTRMMYDTPSSGTPFTLYLNYCYTVSHVWFVYCLSTVILTLLHERQ